MSQYRRVLVRHTDRRYVTSPEETAAADLILQLTSIRPGEVYVSKDRYGPTGWLTLAEAAARFPNVSGLQAPQGSFMEGEETGA